MLCYAMLGCATLRYTTAACARGQVRRRCQRPASYGYSISIGAGGGLLECSVSIVVRTKRESVCLFAGLRVDVCLIQFLFACACIGVCSRSWKARILSNRPVNQSSESAADGDVTYAAAGGMDDETIRYHRQHSSLWTRPPPCGLFLGLKLMTYSYCFLGPPDCSHPAQGRCPPLRADLVTRDIGRIGVD